MNEVKNDTMNEVNDKVSKSNVKVLKNKPSPSKQTLRTTHTPTWPAGGEYSNQPPQQGQQQLPQPGYGYGYGYAPPQVHHHHYYYEAPKPRKGKSSKPTVAGALLILTAVLGLITSIMIVSSGVMFSTADSDGFQFWGMPEKGDVYGRITDLNGTGIPGVTLSIVDEDKTTTSDNDGYYILYNVPTGNQELKVEKEGYNTYIKKIFVSPSEANANWKETSNDNKDNTDNTDNGNEQNFQIVTGNETIKRGYYVPWNMISGLVYGCGILVIIFSIIALLGGYFAIKRKKFGLAIAGAVLGIFTMFGALFALIALFILIISRDEFRRETEEK